MALTRLEIDVVAGLIDKLENEFYLSASPPGDSRGIRRLDAAIRLARRHVRESHELSAFISNCIRLKYDFGWCDLDPPADAERYPQFDDPNSELTKKFWEIAKLSPRPEASGAALLKSLERIADMAAGELKITPEL